MTLRREAVGGDQVVIETAIPFDGRSLEGLPFVRETRRLDPRSMLVTVDDAGTALPDIVQRLGERGTDVTSSREERPSFDAVFATLVERHTSSEADGPDASAAAPPSGVAA